MSGVLPAPGTRAGEGGGGEGGGHGAGQGGQGGGGQEQGQNGPPLRDARLLLYAAPSHLGYIIDGLLMIGSERIMVQ
jgi:hypothetical protein